MYQIETNGPFSNSLKYLRMLHQIPLSFNKSYLKKFFTVFLLSKAVGFSCTTIGPILFLIISTISHAGVNISEAISVTFGASGSGIVCLLFTLKYREWSEFFKDLVDTTQFGTPATYHQTVTFLNRYGKICFLSSFSVTIIYGLAALYNIKECRRTIDGFDQICPSFAPIWLPFGANNITFGAIVFTVQLICMGVLMTQSFLMQCFIMYESTEILICHISHLEDKFKETFEEQLEVRDRLRVCVNYHIHIIRLGNRLSSLIQFTAGHMSLLAALVCGCVAHQLLQTKPMGSLIFLTTWLLALFCFCHMGQRIKDKTQSVADALWESKWYKTDKRTMSDVKFILMRCQKPILFKAVPLGVTDYPFYYMMIKTGYSYFALLNNQSL